jgi:hypothetical protein
MEKIGVGIITYKRHQYFKKVMATIPFDRVDHVVVVNDDPTAEPCNCQDLQYHEIINDKNYGVGISKNKALKYLIDQGCTHLFLIEDDVEIVDPNVFDVYIKTAKRSGLHHLAFGHVGGSLKKQIKGTRTYIDGTGIQMYHNPQGSFCYYLANIINKVGFLDETYKNAFEHVDHEYQLIKAGLLPAFWWFPDVKDSYKYVTITPGGAVNSIITEKEGYDENYKMSASHFVKKWEHFTNQIEDVTAEYVEQRLNFIENNYSRKAELNENKKLAVIIPFRNRHEHLKTMIPELKKVVDKQNPHNVIIVVEQTGGEGGNGLWHDGDQPFNKGALFNAGVQLAKDSGCDYVVLHDVDLIPECSDYTFPMRPTHLSFLVEQFRYYPQYPELFGGVFSISIDDYYKSGGYASDFWGWGKEDDDFYIRLAKTWPDIKDSHLYYGRYKSLPHASAQLDPNWIKKNDYDKKHELTQKYERGEINHEGGAGKTDFTFLNSQEAPEGYTIITIAI